MELKRTMLYATHKQHNAHMRPFAGYEMPMHYGSIAAEHQCVREKAGLFDVSHMCKFRVEGPKAFDLLQYLCTNDVARLSAGDAQYTCLPNEKGGIIDDAILYRLGKARYLLIANAVNRAKNWAWIQKQNEAYKAKLIDISDPYSILALQGPHAKIILQQLTDLELDSIPYYSFGQGAVAQVANVIISHTGYTGAGGYELGIRNEKVEEIWHALLGVGAEPYGLQPIGLGARDTLRLEMGYCLYDQDIDESTSPMEAGLGWITKFNKSFVASEYLQRQKLQGVPKRLIGLLLDEKGAIPRKGCSILNEQALKVGEVTSGGLSFALHRGIALGYVGTNYSTPHTKLWIQIRARSYAAEVRRFPLWKRK